MVVTSIVRDRGRVLGIAVALVVSAALVTAPMALGAGDQVAKGKFSLKVTKGFKKALKKNSVHMGPKNFKIKSGPSRLNPVGGTGKLVLKGKLKFRGHGKKVVASKLIAKIGNKGGNLKGRISGANKTLFRLRSKPGKGNKVVRVGFGAKVSRVSARLGKPLAKAVNKKLGLNSLVTSRKVAQVFASEQPKTVAITGGYAYVDIPCGYLPPFSNPAFEPLCPGAGSDPNTVAAKQPAHCIGPADGVVVVKGDDPNNPARLSTVTGADPVLGPPPSGVAAHFRFPVTGGTVSPAGNDGVLQLAGGVRIQSGYTGADALVFGADPAACADETPGESTSHSILDTVNLAPNLGLLNIQAQTVVGGDNPGCTFTGGGPPGCGVFAGDKGIAIGQVIDASAITVSADPTAHTVAVNGGVIKNNATATTVLNGLFPDGNTPAECVTNPSSAPTCFKDGDKFGISTLNVSTR